MGNSSSTLGASRRYPDAVEPDITHGPEDSLHRRPPAWLPLVLRALYVFRHQSEHRVKVDRALRHGGSNGPPRPIASTACVPSRDSRDGRGRASGRPAPTPHLGSEEVTADSLSKAPRLGMALEKHRLRHPEAPWPGHEPQTPELPRPSGPTDDADGRPQRHLDRRLQGPVPNPRSATP